MTVLKTFLSFYGSKWMVAPKLYPPPIGKTVVEPFAGSAGYSVRYYDRDICLVERDPVIYSIWDYLIKSSREEILRIPLISADQSVDDLNTCQEARWLIGFWIQRGVRNAKKTPSTWMKEKIKIGNMNYIWGERVRARLAWQVEHISHWRVMLGSYEEFDFPGEDVTWFIDPPYQIRGHVYRYGNRTIDYEHLARWCMSREGLVIVCENEGATWLPFSYVGDAVSSTNIRKSREASWVRRPGEDRT